MATKNLFETKEAINHFERYTVAAADIMRARAACVELEEKANKAYNKAVAAANKECNVIVKNVDGKTTGAKVRNAYLTRDAAIDDAVKTRSAAIDKARKAFNETVKNARDTQANILKYVDAGMYAAMLLYNNTGTIDTGAWTTEIKVSDGGRCIEKKAIFVDKSLVECMKSTLSALGFARVDNMTTRRYINRMIVNVAGTRSRGASGHYTRRGMSKDGYKRETIEFIIGTLINPRYEYRTEYDAVAGEYREITTTFEPRYTLDSDGKWYRVQ